MTPDAAEDPVAVSNAIKDVEAKYACNYKGEIDLLAMSKNREVYSYWRMLREKQRRLLKTSQGKGSSS